MKNNYYDLILYLNVIQNKKNLKTFKRSTIILPEFVDKIIYIYNGMQFRKIKITNQMIGTKFGQYCPTRKICKHKKN